MTNCSKAKQRKILKNSVRFAHRCRELLALEYRKNPGILEVMSPRLREEIVTASTPQKPSAKLLMMRLARSSPKLSDRSRWKRLINSVKGLLSQLSG